MMIETVGGVVTELVVRLWIRSLLTIDPTSVVDVTGPTRAAVSFLMTIAFGGAVLYRYGGRLDGAVDASMENPLVSVLYGLVAYGGVVFLLGYVYSQLTRLGVQMTAPFVVMVAISGVLALSLGGFGFAVVGIRVAELVGVRDPWIGLIAVGSASASVWLLPPVFLGAVVWIGIAALGIGGSARLWFHADSGRIEED